jgi:hypothetical protein
MRARSLTLLPLLLLCCRTVEGPTGQGGAQFREGAAPTVALPLEALYAVCWPADVAPAARVTLAFSDGAIHFETADGADNSTARCLREIASAGPQAKGSVELRPPAKPASGWAVLAWVGLLSPGRYGPERGVTQPLPLVRQCLEHGPSSAVFRVVHSPAAAVQSGGPLTAIDRCVEAVLSATVWPSTRPFTFDFAGPAPAGSPGQELLPYFAPTAPSEPPLDPLQVKEALQLVQPQVKACWNQALARREAIGGGRTVRFRVDGSGHVTAAGVAGNASDTFSSAADLLLDRCLLAALQGARFGAGPGDGVYSWVFAER